VEDAKMPLTEHLEELRRRIIICLVAVGVGFCVSYAFSRQIFEVLTWPLVQAMPEGGKIVYTSLQEAFVTYLKVSFFAGLFLAAPVIIYQMWKFVMPGLYPNERRYVLPFMTAACGFFLLGAAFAFFVAFPFGFRFFLSFTTERIQALPSMREYLSLCMSLIIAFGAAFELPVVMFFLARMGIVSHTTLARHRKYAVLLIAIAAAVLTPPDVLSMALLGVPLYALFELSVLVTRFFGGKRRVLEN